MKNIRVIARLDVKGPHLVKGIQFEGLRKLGDPNTFAKKYWKEGADEILYLDIVASLYGRSNLVEILEETTKEVFVPITAGGGVRTVKDAEVLLRAGADKVAVNTGCIKNPELIGEIAKTFGSQCLVLSIEAKRKEDGTWEAYYESGREKSGLDAVAWAIEGAQRGAGEILVTSVDKDGTQRGFDLDLVRSIAESVPVPVICAGGLGKEQDAIDAVREAKADAIAGGAFFHYNEGGIARVKHTLREEGILVRIHTNE
ncbi:MAG: imidazole glycerol phosphate synthase cyclase subunit [Candidatus Yanofskybacteria bacterium]|nr:imidazole glycerol phosphate synthase cyclase subunit [Candidatus Yanofskybacteria bacterium]